MNDREREKRFRREKTQSLKRRTAIQRDTNTEIQRQLKAALERIKTILAGAPSDYQRWSLPQLRKSIEQALAEYERAANATLGTAAGKSWEAGLQMVDGSLEAGGVRIAATLPAVDNRQLQAMRHFMTDRIKDISTTMANRINSQLGLVVIGGQSTGDAVSAVAEILGSGRSRAITIVRTELGRAFSTASNERMTQASEQLPGLKKQWRRSGKIHSRLHHDSIDGQIRDIDKPFMLGNGVRIMYPRDPAAPIGEVVNCGCESLPYMESWEVTNPKRKPFSEQEKQLSATKRALSEVA